MVSAVQPVKIPDTLDTRVAGLEKICICNQAEHQKVCFVFKNVMALNESRTHGLRNDGTILRCDRYPKGTEREYVRGFSPNFSKGQMNVVTLLSNAHLLLKTTLNEAVKVPVVVLPESEFVVSMLDK